MADNTVQGKDALILFRKDEFILFGCATDFSLEITTDKQAIRTINSGPWKQYAGQNLSWTLTLNGVMKFDDTKFTGWDIYENQVNFIDIVCQLTYTDDEGNQKSFRGNVIVDSSNFGVGANEVATEEFRFTGNGPLMFFDGSIPCDSDITAITITGGTGSEDTETVEFSNTGDVNVNPANTVVLVNILAQQNIQVGMYVKLDSILYLITGVTYSAFQQNYYLTVTGDPPTGYQFAVPYQIISVENGDVTITYTYTGSPVQVKYRVDNQGDYIYNGVGVPIVIPSPSTGEHQIEIIPICSNTYEGNSSMIQLFEVTNGLTCSSSIDAIIVTGTGPGTATNVNSGSATIKRTRIDSGPWVVSLIDAAINLTGLAIGNHTIEMVPICDNGVLGTGTTQDFTFTTTAGFNQIIYSFADNKTGPGILNNFIIRVNGLIMPIAHGTTSGTLQVSTGDVVTAEVSMGGFILGPVNRTGTLGINDSTTATVLYNSSHANPYTLMFTFTTMNNDSYTIVGAVN